LKLPLRDPKSVAMRIELNWKRPLFYCVLPILIFLAFVGFPPPFAPLASTKAAQEQSVQAEDGQSEL
jgi:hypothetical protein